MLLRRAAALFLIGWAFSVVWEADILHFYGMYLLVGAVLLPVSRRLLASVAILIWLVSAAIYIDSGGDPALEAYMGVWRQFAPLADDLLVGGTYAAFPWLVFLSIGMWIGKSADAFSPRAWKSIAIVGLALMVTGEVVSLRGLDVCPGFIDADIWELLTLSDSFPVSPLFAVSTAAGCAALIAGLRLIDARVLAWRWLAPVCATGRMSMTLYIAHILLARGVAKGIGLISGTEAYRQAAYMATILICISSLGVAHWWLKSHSRGPLEQFFRWLSTSKFGIKKDIQVPVSP